MKKTKIFFKKRIEKLTSKKTNELKRSGSGYLKRREGILSSDLEVKNKDIAK